MDSSHGYRAFGLNIQSAFEIPFWTEGAPPWDVRIGRGEVPGELSDAEPLWDGVFYGRKGIGLFDFPRIGRVFAEAGTRVEVEPVADVNPLWLANTLASTVMAAVLYQRGGLCLHASSVGWRGRAYLIMGPSGAGKSTTATALLARGGEFISDDITVITEREKGEFVATSSFPALRLREDSHGEVGPRLSGSGLYDLADDKIRLRYDGARVTEPMPVARICFLEKDATTTAPHSVPLAGHERVGALQRNYFRRRMAKIVADPVRLAAMSIALAQSVDVVRLTRPETGFALDELSDLVVA